MLLVPFILWALWMFWAYKKKKKPLFYFQLVILVLAVGYLSFSLGLFPGSQSYYSKKYTAELTGQEFLLDKLEYSYDSDRSFNGDGYSIAVYNIDDDISKLFINPDPQFFVNYPAKNDSRKDWSLSKWKKTPVSDKDQKFIDFALSPISPQDKKESEGIKKQFELIRKMLKDDGHYYSYLYKINGSMIGNVDFYILSVKDKKIIFINHNT